MPFHKLKKMKYASIIFLLLLVIGFLFSCSKDKENSPHVISELVMPAGGGKDNFNRPIAMRVANDQNESLQNVSVTAINGTDTLQDLTDINGSTDMIIPRTGLWHIFLYLSGHYPKDTVLDVNTTDTIPKSIILNQE
jgi:tripartite-type tricarboxylate transporter receptor subunit TctC